MGETGHNGAVLSAEHDDVRVVYQVKRVTRWQVGEVRVAHRVSELLYVCGRLRRLAYTLRGR
jgi:hypothetical protein